MKKLFMVLCSIFLITNSTFAAETPWTAEKCKEAPKCFEWTDENNKHTMLIFFHNHAPLTGQPGDVFPTKIEGRDISCEQEIRTALTEFIGDHKQQIAAINLFGSASTAGGDSINDSLAETRTTLVYNLINEIINNNDNITIYKQNNRDNTMFADEHGCSKNNPYHRIVKVDFSGFNVVEKTNTITKTAEKEKINEAEKTAIKTPFEKLNNFAFLSAERKQWKDAEGKFNTSRLISDSVAGAVLGTTTGLITGTVIKKNQIKDGFEDIKCTVGNQTMAAWGDSFYVNSQ